MKIIASLILFLAMHTANAQFVYITCEAPFSVSNSQSSATFTKVWVKFSSNYPAEIRLASGEVLHRRFKIVPQPYYVIENKKVRYRPNVAIEKADTLYIAEKPSSTVEKTTVVNAVEVEKQISNWETILAEINALGYEWEKTERIKEVLSSQTTSCNQQADLLKCLQYDGSRVEVMNKGNVSPDCLPELEQLVAVMYRKTIIKR